MKHICYLTGMFSRYDSIIYERQGRSMAQAGYRVTYIVCDSMQNENSEGIEIISCGFIPKNRFDRIRKSSKYLYENAMAVNADIYQISEPELINIGLKLKKRNKKIIYNMREYSSADLKYKSYLSKYFRIPASFALEQYMKISLNKYDLIFVVTPEIVDVVKQKWKISQTYLLINCPRVNADFHLSYDEYVKRGNVLCYFGTIYSTSRQENILIALEKINNVKYLVAGIFGVDADYIVSLPNWSKVQFINGFKRNQLSEILAQCSMSNVLRDDSKSGTPNGSLGVLKFFESMEAGLPIICSDVPVNRSIIDQYLCGICTNVNDPEAIQETISYLINNKKQAYEMGQNGRKAIIEKYNWDNQFSIYFDNINNLWN